MIKDEVLKVEVCEIARSGRKHPLVIKVNGKHMHLQNETGEWRFVSTSKDQGCDRSLGIPATVFEVALWKKVENYKEAVAEMTTAMNELSRKYAELARALALAQKLGDKNDRTK